MKEIFVITGTVTYAMKAKEILVKKGYFADVKRWNDKTGKYGCGYGVKAVNISPDEAKTLLGENGVKIIDVVVQKI
ncbi:MAG: hypothetical protein IKV36_02590 [Clostridia bacterium]|nr:hypothetical protein [Clostridia bacterium]